MKRLLLTLILILLLSVPALAQTPGTPTFPTSIDTQSTLLELANNAASTLSGGINNSDTTLTVANATAFASTGAVTIDAEIILYTGKSGNQLTGLTRGAFGTSAASHSNGVAVRQNVLAQHFTARSAAIIAAQTKLGSGSSTPLSGTVLSGTGTGTSAWQTLNSTPATTFTIGSGTAASGNTFVFNVSSSGSKPGIRYDGSKWQSSNDGTNWTDIGIAGGAVGGSGTIGAIPVYAGPTTLGSSLLSQSGDTVVLSGNHRVTSKIALGSQGSFFQGGALNISETYTTEGAGNGIELLNVVSTTGNVSVAVYGVNSVVNSANSAIYDDVFGGSFFLSHTGSGALATARGVRGQISHPGLSTISNARAVEAVINQTGTAPSAITNADLFHANGSILNGSVTTWTNFRGANPTITSGTLSAFYGIQLDDADAVSATTKMAMWSKGGTVKLEKLILDIGERAAPAVSASGFARIYFDSTSKKLRASENGGAYVDMVGGGGGGGGDWDAITAPAGNQALSMAAHLTTWTWNATTGSNDLLTIANSSNDTGTNALVAISTPGASNAKSPLKVSARGSTAFLIDSTGAVNTYTNTLASANGSSTSTPRLAGLADLDGSEAVRLQLGDSGNSIQLSAGGRMAVQSFWGLILSGSRQTATPRSYEAGTSGDSSVTIYSEAAARTPLDIDSSTGLTAPIVRARNNGTTKWQVIAGGTAAGTGNTLSGSGSQTFDLSLGNVQELTLTGNVTSLAVSNLQNNTFYTFILKQDAGGGRTLSGVSSTFKFAGGTVPPLTGTANAVDVWDCVARGSVLYCLPNYDVK
jgi:hypothetical protein